MNLNNLQPKNLPPIRKLSQPTKYNRINEIPQNHSFSPQKQPRTQSMHTLDSQVNEISQQQQQLISQRILKPIYNKWYVPPNKRFLDLKQQSKEFLQEQYIQNLYAQRQLKYNQIISESKQLSKFIIDFQKQFKRNPTFIH